VRYEAQAQRNSGPFKVIWGEPGFRVKERLPRLRDVFQKASEARRSAVHAAFHAFIKIWQIPEQLPFRVVEPVLEPLPDTE